MKISTPASFVKAFTNRTIKALAILFAILFFADFSNAQSQSMSTVSIKLLLNLNGGASNTADGCLVAYRNGFSTAIGNEDTHKFTNLDENLAINRDSELLSIEGRPEFVSTDTIPLKMWQFRQTDYYLSFSCTNFPSGLEAIVKDSYLKQERQLALGGIVYFPFQLNPSDSASYSPDRFKVVFRTSATLSCFFSEVKASVRNNNAQVDWTACSQASVERYEVERATNGFAFVKLATIAPSASATKSYSWLDERTNNGNNYYRIKGIEKSGKMVYSSILKVNTSREESDVIIYPNPVKGNTIGLQLLNLEQGKYAVRIYNDAGQEMFTGSLQHNGNSSTQSMQLKNKLPKGVYRLRLSNENTQIIRPVLFD